MKICVVCKARVIVEGQMSFFLLVTNLDVLICVFELNSCIEVHTLSKRLLDNYRCA